MTDEITELTRAVAADLQACMDRHRAAFPDPPMGPGLAGKLARAIAWGAPWHTPDQLRPAARTSLWIFAVDWLVDHEAVRAEQVHDLVGRCLDIADGATPDGDDALGLLLADLRTDLTSSAAGERLRPVWRLELERMLLAMGREWEWNAARAEAERQGSAHPPETVTLEEYLGNADNFGSTWVNVTHWITLGDPSTLPLLDTLREASGLVQQILRLLNDQATLGRDRTWGDLNAYLLGADDTWTRNRITALTRQTAALLEPLRTTCPREADYLHRQIAHSTAFYGGDHDYWDTL